MKRSIHSVGRANGKAGRREGGKAGKMGIVRPGAAGLEVCLALVVLVALACGGPAHPRTPTIEELRARAAAAPNDAAAQYALAEAELLLSDGDASRAEAQIRRALALAPDDLRLHYLSAVEREHHGHPSAALDGYAEVIRRAKESADPLAPALAEVAAAELESLDDGAPRFGARVGELARVHASPGRIGPGARSTLGDLLMDIAYRQGELARVNALTEAQRCVTEWRVAGPFGPRALLGFDRALAPENDETLAAHYDYGPGRGDRETRTVRTRGCTANLGNGPVGGAGTTYAEATVEVPEGGPWLLRVETPNSAAISIDGREVARLDRRVEALGSVSFHPVELTAGSHRLRVKIASRHPSPALAVSLSRDAPPGEVEGESLVAEHARVTLAMSRGDVVTARERLRPRLVREGSSVFLAMGAAASLNDPQRSTEVRHDEARRLLEWSADRDAEAWYPRLTLAQLDANQGRDQAAIEALTGASARWPELVIFPLQLVDLLEDRGWHAQADAAIAAAREALPDACRPLRASLVQARRRSRADEEMAHARALVECDARSDALVSTYIRRREWDPAVAELTRLAALEPEEAPVSVLSARLGLAQGRGDDAEVASLLRQLQSRMPQSESPILMEVDRILAGGQRPAAIGRLGEQLAAEPSSTLGMRRVQRAIGGDDPLAAYRRDGAEVIRALEASDRTYNAPMLLVLDYTVYRVFEDGSMLELTHNIFRLQTQEAVDAMGELAVPEEAHMLTLQTVKQDGRRLEPDEIAGKDTISFPSLSPGDYIEFEYVRPHPAPAGYPGGFLGDRFYFRNFETPFDVSELTVVTPRDVELVVDPRGEAPETELRVEGDVRVYRWGVTESRPLVQEPGSVTSREFFPSIAWGHGASWAMYVESLRDVLADRDPRDPAAERVVQRILGSEAERATLEQRARRIYRWVLENIDDDPNGAFGIAPAMLAARSGHRTRVLRYLLELAGLEADLVLARSFAADATRSELPDDDTYQNLLVRVSGGPEPIWLYTGQRGAPFGYVPPVLGGMDALVLNEAAERVEVAPRPLEADLHTVEVDVELNASGGAQVRVVETFRGSGAVGWREQLEQIPEADLERRFESAYVASLLGGGTLSRLAISGREDAEQPLVLRYEVQMESLARRARGGWVIPAIFPAHLGGQFAPVASRSRTQLIAGGLALDVSIRIATPEGSAIASAPADVTLEALGARATMESVREDGRLTLRRTFRVPRMRVPPTDYPELARFCRAADEAESAEVAVRAAR